MALALTGFEAGLFIHILAVVVAFGPTFGYGFFISFAERGERTALPGILRAINSMNMLLVTPAMLVVLLAGLYLVIDNDISMSETYVSVGFLAIILLFGLVHGYFVPRGRRAAELAQRDVDAGGELSPEYRALSKQIALVGQLAGLIVAVTIFFMVVKP